MSDRLLTKRDLAQRWTVSLRTVNYWIERKLIGFVKIRHVIRFTERDVEAFEAKYRVGAPRS